MKLVRVSNSINTQVKALWRLTRLCMALVFCACVAVTTLPAPAQAETGEIVIRVVDATRGHEGGTTDLDLVFPGTLAMRPGHFSPTGPAARARVVGAGSGP